MEKNHIRQIKSELKNIKSRYEQKCGAAIFNAGIKKSGSGVIIEGIVLTDRQKKEAFLSVKTILKEKNIKNNIKVLGAPAEKLEIGWGFIMSDIADFWAVFPDKKNNRDKNSVFCGGRGNIVAGERDRATQATKGDIVRILAKKGNYFLAQTRDLTISWTEKRKISVFDGTALAGKKLKSKWIKTKKAKKGEAIKTVLTNKKRNKFIAFLKNYLYVSYIWGGTTEIGIDCSGLVQKFYHNIFGVMLPRHSSDQAEYGAPVDFEKSQFGDLIFLRQKTKKYSHIGIIIEADRKLQTGKFLILNACREKGEVVIQSAEEILKKYNLISIKRIIK